MTRPMSLPDWKLHLNIENWKLSHSIQFPNPSSREIKEKKNYKFEEQCTDYELETMGKCKQCVGL